MYVQRFESASVGETVEENISGIVLNYPAEVYRRIVFSTALEVYNLRSGKIEVGRQDYYLQIPEKRGVNGKDVLCTLGFEEGEYGFYPLS